MESGLNDLRLGSRGMGCRFSKAVETACACYGWFRALMHTRKKRREQPVSMNVVGRWIPTPPAHFGEGELRSRERRQGTVTFRVRAANNRELLR